MFYLKLFLVFFFFDQRELYFCLHTVYYPQQYTGTKKIMHRLQNEFQCSVFNPKPNSGFSIFSLKILLFGV